MKTVAQRSVVGTPLAATSRNAAPRSRGPSQQPQILCHRNETAFDASKVAAGVALSSSLLASQPVQAAQEFATLAAGDNRLGAVAILFVPAIAWVLFNITGPANRQLARMQGGKPKPAAPKASPRAAPSKPPAKKPAPRPVAKKPAPKPVAKKPAPKRR